MSKWIYFDSTANKLFKLATTPIHNNAELEVDCREFENSYIKDMMNQIYRNDGSMFLKKDIMRDIFLLSDE